MADMLEEAVATMRGRTARLRGKTRQHIPTADEPLIVLVIDELADLTAYLTDRQLKDRIKAALGVLLTQGRAVGVHVVAASRTRARRCCRSATCSPPGSGCGWPKTAEVDMVLGDGMRDRGALCDRIPTDRARRRATSCSTATRPRCGSGSPTSPTTTSATWPTPTAGSASSTARPSTRRGAA